MADWKAIKTEYITTETSYRKLAEKYGVGYQTICARSKSEHWIEQREQHTNKTVTAAIEKIGEGQAERISRIDEAADMLLDKVIEFMTASEDMLVNTQSMKHISGVLKDIKEIKGMKSEADLREQEARIAKLRREAEREEGTNEPIRVVMEGELEEYSG